MYSTISQLLLSSRTKSRQLIILHFQNYFFCFYEKTVTYCIHIPLECVLKQQIYFLLQLVSCNPYFEHLCYLANPTNKQYPKSPEPTPASGNYHQTDPYQASSEEKGLINKNVQSTSFKLLQRALEHEELMEGAGGDDHENSGVIPKLNIATSQVKAPRIKDPVDEDHERKGR